MYIFNLYSVDLLIFVCLNFRKFLILRLLPKLRICEFLFLAKQYLILIIPTIKNEFSTNIIIVMSFFKSFYIQDWWKYFMYIYLL